MNKNNNDVLGSSDLTKSKERKQNSEQNKMMK